MGFQSWFSTQRRPERERIDYSPRIPNLQVGFGMHLERTSSDCFVLLLSEYSRAWTNASGGSLLRKDDDSFRSRLPRDRRDEPSPSAEHQRLARVKNRNVRGKPDVLSVSWDIHVCPRRTNAEPS